MSSAPKSRFANVHEAATTPVNEDVWHNLPESVQNRARGVANLANDGGTSGESDAARQAYWRMREAHGFADLRRIFLLERPRTPEGTFAGGDTAGSPADMAAAYGPPETRPAAMLNGGVLAAAQKLAKQKKG